MFSEDILFYMVNALAVARVTIETLVAERNDLSPLCAVGKSITDLEHFEKIVNDLAGNEMSSDFAKLKMAEALNLWRGIKDSYVIKVEAPTAPTLLFLSAALGSGTFALAAIETNIAKMNNAAANDVISYSKSVFVNVTTEVNTAGRAYFSR